jgi:hypothetical protein
MINFFKNIFNNNNNKKTTNTKTDDIICLNFDRMKKNYLIIKILQSQSCQEILTQYYNDILTELQKLSGAKPNLNEFAFLIIDDENIFTELKLRPKDTPLNYLKKKSVNLYYLNVLDKKKEDQGSFVSEKALITDSGVTNSDVMSIQTTIEDCIREGELLKYSRKHKKYDRRIVKLDKNKLVITKLKAKEMEENTIILLSDIDGIAREVSDKTLKDKYLFEITTFEGERYVLRSKCNADLESWIESIMSCASLVKDNKFLIMYSDNITKVIKEIYERSTRIIANCLSLKGVVSIKETRHLLFKLFGNELLCNILERTIIYKQNVKCYKYFDAWDDFQEIYKLLKLDKINADDTQKSPESKVRKSSYDVDVKERKILIERKTSKDSSEDRTTTGKKHSVDSNLDLDPNFEAMVRQIVSSDNLKYLKKLRKELKELVDKNSDNRQNNEVNSKLYDLLKPNVFSDIYENLLVKNFNNFYKTISKEKEFTDQIEMILQHVFKEKNSFKTDNLIDLESSLYSQQTFYTRMTMPTDTTQSSDMVIDNKLKKINSSMNIINFYSANDLSK